MDVDAVLDRMCLAMGKSDHASLASAMGRDVTTFRVWRNRKKIPSAVLMDLVVSTGRPLQWFTDEAEPAYSTPQPAATSGEAACEESPVFFAPKTKQINQISSEEEAMLLAFRSAPPKVKQAILTMVQFAAKNESGP